MRRYISYLKRTREKGPREREERTKGADSRRDCGDVESTSVKHGTRLTRVQACCDRSTCHKSVYRFFSSPCARIRKRGMGKEGKDQARLINGSNGASICASLGEYNL
ncbi:hypothetical protein PUN28_001722 [Cardiocondyla obscurior]|uniref:Uncharacterized protein n=1 Tax=Cardiocondyla obscurior TaxID=286306 RepID=A0AAW2GQZ3_9HYME